jgi:hypothetical protein
MSIRIGDKIVDDTGAMGTVGALQGDTVDIDMYTQFTIPRGCSGISNTRGWFVIKNRFLSGAHYE